MLHVININYKQATLYSFVIMQFKSMLEKRCDFDCDCSKLDWLKWWIKNGSKQAWSFQFDWLSHHTIVCPQKSNLH